MFQDKNCSYDNSAVKWKSWKHQDGLDFPNFMNSKKQNLLFYSSNVACQQYWSSENKVKASRYQKQSPKGVLWKRCFQNRCS